MLCRSLKLSAAVALAFAPGCFDSSNDSAGSVSTTGGPAGRMMGSSSSGDGAVPVGALDACRAACEADAACRSGVDVSGCTGDCLTGAAVFGGECAELIVDEAGCIGTLSCAELEAYQESRRDHDQCGDIASELLAKCTINDGVPPEACQRFCEAGEECGVSQVGVATCADNCLFVLTGLDQSSGSACADVQRRAFQCLAEQTCADLELTLEVGSTPPACESFEVEFALTCG